MPNRMLRDWTCSEKINEVSVHAERFFTRLIMKVDDYGCFFADTRLLKANLFPLLLDSIREADLLRWMDECQKAGLIVLYENSGKKYIQILDFKQRLDRAKSKFPLPSVNESVAVVNESPPEEKRSRIRKEEEGNAPPPDFGEIPLPVTDILVCFDAEEFILNNRQRFEQICMKVNKSEAVARDSLHKYHLWLDREGKYPVSQSGVFSGFELWLRKEKEQPQTVNHARTSAQEKREAEQRARRNALLKGSPAS